MKKLMISCFLLMATLWTGCSIIDDGINTSTFVIQVDSINVPTEIASSDTLAIRPFGRVGPNGCYSFKRFEASRTSSSLELKLIGKLVEGNDIGCFSAIVELYTIFKVPPPLEGPFGIKINQPDESVLSRTVEVKE